MKRYLFLLFIIVIGFSVSDVQKEFVNLDWQTLDSASNKSFGEIILNFEGAHFPVSDSPFPIYTKIYNLKNNKQDFKIIVENKVFRAIDIPEKLKNVDNINNEVRIKSQKLKSGDNFQIQLQITPLKKVGDKLYLLERFELKQIPITTKSVTPQKFNWNTKSVLETGKWVKIETSGKGIFKIPFSKLTEWGFSNPSNVNVFGSGGTVLSENPSNIEFDDLNQNAVWYGKNNGTDCLFFYAPGSVEWSLNSSGEYFEHKLNDYSNSGCYFLSEDVGNSKNVEVLSEITEELSHTIESFDAYELYEDDLENVLPEGSGKKWFGEKYRNGSVKNIDFELKNIENSSTIAVQVAAISRSSKTSEINILVNQNEIGKLNFGSVNTGSQTSTYADDEKELFTEEVQTEQLRVSTEFFGDNVNGSVDDNATAWLDFIEINYRKKLKAGDETVFFRDINSVGTDNVIEMNIESASVETKVFDVTDMHNMKEVPLLISGNVATAKRPADELREYALVNTNGIFPEPVFVSEVENQNLHALETPDFLIITHPNYLNSANQLADFHRVYDNMSVEVVNVNQVYNEFSSGSKNATGIRNFIKMFYDRESDLKYVLLFGDGSYDNKNINQDSKNFIPTFQSENSLSPVASFVTDDYYVILDGDESVYNGSVDLGIGRIPASTAFEAELVVNKVLNYYSAAALGDWRNVVCFIGDDQDDNQTMHMLDSEKLANFVNENHPEFKTDKIYFDAFTQEATPAGERYPDVTDAINKRVKDGVLVLNYVGHANARFMADERVLDISDINSWSNSNNLPIFVTATCEFSRFDADVPSAGEYILFNPSGGGIGLFSTTRLVFAYSNFLLSRSFYNFVFQKDEAGNHYRMGDIMRLAKINTINTTNKRNFSLLADPALKLSYPERSIVTTNINEQAANGLSDTIGALQEISITGYISDFFGNKINDFSGEIVPIVYDKEVQMNTQGNGGYDPINFKVRENIIHKGLASVTNGDFSFSFVVPKDISYNVGKGKIIYYAKNGEIDAHGSFENFVIGSSDSEIITDNIGPDIQLFMDSENFLSGDRTSRSPTLLAFLSDENGINTVGNGIGHDITAVLDDDYSNVLVLNNFYQSNLDDYTSGSINFTFQNLSVGKHSLKLKAWDVANNSSEVEIEFEVSGDFYIEEVMNYPNPLDDYTFFTFKHNHSDATLETIIEIFDQSGMRVDYLSQQVGSNGTSSNPVRWDMNESQIQLRSGIYIYRITAQNNDGLIALKSGKMMITR